MQFINIQDLRISVNHIVTYGSHLVQGSDKPIVFIVTVESPAVKCFSFKTTEERDTVLKELDLAVGMI